MQKTMQKIGNALVKPLLRSPLHFLFSGSIMLITFTGRKSGRVYTIPVQYMREENTVTFMTPRKRIWWKNLRDQAKVTLLLRGRKVPGTVTTIIDDQDVVLATAKRMYPQVSDARMQAMMPDYLMLQIKV